jgi:hypothetical protein
MPTLLCLEALSGVQDERPAEDREGSHTAVEQAASAVTQSRTVLELHS